DRLRGNIVESRDGVDEIPNVVRSFKKRVDLQLCEESRKALRGEILIQIRHFLEDVVCAHGGILKIRSRLAVKVQRFLEVKRDDGGAREFQQEVPQGADSNLMRDLAHLVLR